MSILATASVMIGYERFDWTNATSTRCTGNADPPSISRVLLSLYAKKWLSLDEIVTRTHPLLGLAEAFEHMKQRMNAKGVLIPNVSN